MSRCQVVCECSVSTALGCVAAVCRVYTVDPPSYYSTPVPPGLCNVDNLRTLCVVCHAAVTREQHRKWAERRRQAKAVVAAFGLGGEGEGGRAGDGAQMREALAAFADAERADEEGERSREEGGIMDGGDEGGRKVIEKKASVVIQQKDCRWNEEGREVKEGTIENGRESEEAVKAGTVSGESKKAEKKAGSRKRKTSVNTTGDGVEMGRKRGVAVKKCRVGGLKVRGALPVKDESKAEVEMGRRDQCMASEGALTGKEMGGSRLDRPCNKSGESGRGDIRRADNDSDGCVGGEGRGCSSDDERDVHECDAARTDLGEKGEGAMLGGVEEEAGGCKGKKEEEAGRAGGGREGQGAAKAIAQKRNHKGGVSSHSDILDAEPDAARLEPAAELRVQATAEGGGAGGGVTQGIERKRKRAECLASRPGTQVAEPFRTAHVKTTAELTQEGGRRG